MAGDEYTPEADSSYGLVYRLNFLWSKVDRDALTGDFDKWELTLDRIFANLLYREDIETEEDEEGNVIEVSISEKDSQIWQKFKENIKLVKKNKLIALRKKQKSEFYKLKIEHYNTVLSYDIWVRKFMQTLKLYMRESSSNPSGSLFGGAFKKKR